MIEHREEIEPPKIDPLTGLLTTYWFNKAIDRAVGRTVAEGEKELWLIYLYLLPERKPVRPAYDNPLRRTLGECLQETTDQENLGRVGLNKFGILLSNVIKADTHRWWGQLNRTLNERPGLIIPVNQIGMTAYAGRIFDTASVEAINRQGFISQRINPGPGRRRFEIVTTLPQK